MLTAILVAAGDSRRMGFDKLFATIAGKPVIAHTIRAFERAGCVGGIIIVAREDRLAEIKKIARDEKLKKVQSIIPGGKHRQDSVRAGLDHLDPATKYVAVHDAARPLITVEQIERVFEQGRIHTAASLAEPISDTAGFRAPLDRGRVSSCLRRECFGYRRGFSGRTARSQGYSGSKPRLKFQNHLSARLGACGICSNATNPGCRELS
jgi:2-C-methyl-D-erythritol 4-phosphate cytidylyltransferase